MPYHRYHVPRIFRLTSTVGACGTNNPDEVKSIQRLINDAGYQFATGRTLPTNGQCDTATTEAIRWYQRLLNLSPSGLVQPADTWFIRAISEATTPG